MNEWKTKPQPQLEDTIAAFKSEFPGWWYTLGECQVSCDATIAPTTESVDIELIREAGDEFDAGFSVDLAQPSTLSEALIYVMDMARKAKAERAMVQE